MALVQMKCPNCGGVMKTEREQFVCPNCRTMILNIVDAKIDADVTVMSPEEFAKEIAKSKRRFVVNVNNNLQVFDVKTRVINKKISDALKELYVGKFKNVFQCLDGVSSDVLAAERLRFLAHYEVGSEASFLSLRARDTKNLTENYHYKKILELADEQTRATYLKIGELCETKKKVEEEILQIDQLIGVQLYSDALTYAKEMCRKYPFTAVSWEALCKAKLKINENCSLEKEFKMMEMCADHQVEECLPKSIQETLAKRRSYDQPYVSEETKRIYRLFFGFSVSFVATIGAWRLLPLITSSEKFIFTWLGGVLFLTTLICTLVFAVKMFKKLDGDSPAIFFGIKKIESNYRKGRRSIPLIPDADERKWRYLSLKREKREAHFYNMMCFLSWAIMIFGIILIVFIMKELTTSASPNRSYTTFSFYYLAQF